jgi:hypothetical protein
MKPIYALMLTVSLVASAPLPAKAQPATSDAVPAADALLADEFARAALTMLSLPQTGDHGYTQDLAAVLLDQAIALDPTNSQLWVFRSELAQQMSDDVALEAALTGYLRTGVVDDKAQLDLIRLRLAKHQTLDEQYRALEQLLNSEGAQRLSDPLRSRLASYAASLAQELVDPDAQARWVVEAARLDPANAEAAGMLLEIVTERGGDTLRRGTAMINVVRASPMDPWTRLDLAALLASEGAYERAAQQYQLVDSWIGSSPFVLGDKVFRQLLPAEAYRTWLTTLATTGNDPLALQIIHALEEYYTAYNQAANLAVEQGTDPADITPMPEHLPTELEMVRLAVLDSPSDAEAAAASFERIEDDFAHDTEGDNAGRLALVAAVFGPDLDKARMLAEALPEDGVDRSLALGWVAARSGDAEAARSLLNPLVGSQPLAACGLAMLEVDDDAGRARRYQEVVHTAPGTLAALAAGRQLSRDGRPLPPTRVGQALLERMSKFTESLWLVDVTRNPWLDARMRITPARFNHLEPISAEITLWNTTRFPIAIGEQEFIRPRAIIQINANVQGQPLPPSGPVVVDLGRKLTLGPGERLIFDTRIDYHNFGTLRSLNPGYGILFDARLIVNPVVGNTGAFIPSATGGVSTVRDCIVQGAPPTAQSIEAWLTQMEAGSPRERYSAIARVASLNRAGSPELLTRATESRLREVMAEKLAGWDENTASWAMLFLRMGDDAESTYGPVAAEWVRQSDSQRVWLAYLARQVKDPESEMLREAIRRQDLATVAAFAETYRRALREAVIERERMQQEMEEAQRLQQQQLEQQQRGGAGTRP